ncbi:hypothetical protein EYF80_058373 [Liparis tanakae]|uniref:Uncharacterized protein n=1 Tax=Liparis tanakae TaxID=230148 RepID=A0A4Z2ERL3_9TELE|nr:hypothetical protein EYF80_058373 [Liparis tanakae]
MPRLRVLIVTSVCKRGQSEALWLWSDASEDRSPVCVCPLLIGRGGSGAPDTLLRAGPPSGPGPGLGLSCSSRREAGGPFH